MPIKVISFISKPYGKEAIIYSTISTWISLKTVQAIFCCIVLLPSAFMFHPCCLQCLYACVFSPLLVSQLTHIFQINVTHISLVDSVIPNPSSLLCLSTKYTKKERKVMTSCNVIICIITKSITVCTPTPIWGQGEL